MKKSLFIPTLISVFFAFSLLFLINCKSTPPELELPSDIWSILRDGDSNVMDYFLGEYDVNDTDAHGRTPIYYAIERGDVNLTRFFISIGAEIDIFDNSMLSPLAVSIENNDIAIIGLLVSAGADIFIPYYRTTAANFALSRNPEIFGAIVTPATIEVKDSTGKNLLHMASISGNPHAVQIVVDTLYRTSLSINERDYLNKNALDYALERTDSRNHMEAAEYLILNGAYTDNMLFNFFGPAVRSANYNIRRNDGLAPIHYAVINSYTGLIEFLLEKNIDINIKSTSGASALHEAVRVGEIPVIIMLLERGADVNARDAKGNTPLHTGIPSHVHREVVILLMNYGADPNLRDEYGDTPLHIGVTLNRTPDVIQAILSGGADVHIRNIEGKTPLYIAVQEGRTLLIPLLISYGSEIFAADNSGVTPFDIALRTNNNTFNIMVTPESVIQRDSAGNTMLHMAVRNWATPEQIGRILDNRANVDARNREGDTSLHIAVRTNQRESGVFLISRGADIYSLNSAGQSPLFIALVSNPVREWIINSTTIILKDGLGNNMLHLAAQWNLNNVIPTIIRNGVFVEEPNATGETPLFMAVKTNSPSTITVLVENTANLNARDTQGNSVLHTAVRWNAKEAAQLLISYRMDINAHSLNGNTPLHDAVINRVPDIETLLINSGANLEARNMDGNTPLMEAVRSGFLDSVEKLALNNADSSTRNTVGNTPLHIAVSTENIELVNMLLRMGVSIHARNTRNRTPFNIALSISPQMVSTLLTTDRISISDDYGNSVLHIALQERASAQIIRTIMSRGARLNAVDSNGRTPLRLAVDLELFDSAKIIADAGADPFISAVDNKTPAEVAFSKGYDCIRALFSGRLIDSRDNLGNTILHLAASIGSPQSISLLLELGANKSIRNISLETPFETAIRWHRYDNAEALR